MLFEVKVSSFLYQLFSCVPIKCLLAAFSLFPTHFLLFFIGFVLVCFSQVSFVWKLHFPSLICKIIFTLKFFQFKKLFLFILFYSLYNWFHLDFMFYLGLYLLFDIICFLVFLINRILLLPIDRMAPF